MKGQLCSERPVPVIEVLSYDEVFEVVVYGSLIVLEQRVGVAQTVAGLGLHGPVLQLPGQLQCSPGEHTHTPQFKTLAPMKKLKSFLRH